MLTARRRPRADDAAAEGSPEDALRPQRTVLQWVRRLILIAAVVCAGLFVRRYDFETLPQVAVPAVEGKIPAGARLLFVPADEPEHLRVGAVVEVEVEVAGPDGLLQRGLVLSVIAATPGQELRFRAVDEGRAEILVDGQRTYRTLDPDAAVQHELTGRLAEGPIPDGHYLLLNAHDPRPGETAGWDGLRFGLVKVTQFRRRVVSWF